jgi:hypothetical protein
VLSSRRRPSTLPLALAVLPSFAFAPQGDLGLYLATAAHYASGNRTAALREIRQWGLSQIEGATMALLLGEKRLRSVVKDPDDIDFHIVEAAILLHAETGLLFLQDHRLRWAKVHLDTSVQLQQWSRRAAADARNRAAMHRYAFKDRPADPRLELQESIDGRDFYVALAAAALALGYAETAIPFAAQALHDAPLDAEVQLVLGRRR